MSYNKPSANIPPQRVKVCLQWSDLDEWRSVGVATLQVYRHLRRGMKMTRRDANLFAMGHAAGLNPNQVFQVRHAKQHP